MRVKTGELTLKDAYKVYKLSTPKPVEYKKYCDICKDLHEAYYVELHLGRTVKLPKGVGSVSLRKSYKRLNNKTIDWNHLRLTGEKKLYDNRHSDGYAPYIHWEKRNGVFPQLTPYIFEPTRYRKRDMAKLFKIVGAHKLFPITKFRRTKK